jgi:hypothetical protein
MKHARNHPPPPPASAPTVEPPWLKPPYFEPPVAPAGAEPMLSREDLMGLRRLADAAAVPPVCPEPECRKAGHCRAPCRRCRFVPTDVFPPCIVIFLEDLYAPVARYHGFRRCLADLTARLDPGEPEQLPAGKPRRPR